MGWHWSDGPGKALERAMRWQIKMSWRTFFLFLFFLIILGVLFVGRFVQRHPCSASVKATTENPQAFLNARWGMSVMEVERANHSRLEMSVSGSRFYRGAPDTEKRSQTWESRGQKFLGRPAVVSYTFLDNRLFICHVFISDKDADVLDKDMKQYLIRVFGGRYSLTEDETSLKMVWHFKDKIVNYWFYEEDLALIGKFKAGFGVVYKPIEETFNPVEI